jgi:hypothetical protein
MRTANKYKSYKSPDDLPAMLKVKDCASFLGVNVNKMYSIFKRDNFHSIKLSGRYMVTKEEFLRWIDEQSQK